MHTINDAISRSSSSLPPASTPRKGIKKAPNVEQQTQHAIWRSSHNSSRCTFAETELLPIPLAVVGLWANWKWWMSSSRREAVLPQDRRFIVEDKLKEGSRPRWFQFIVKKLSQLWYSGYPPSALELMRSPFAVAGRASSLAHQATTFL